MYYLFLLIEVHNDEKNKNKLLRKKIKLVVMGCKDLVCKTNQKNLIIIIIFLFLKIIPTA